MRSRCASCSSTTTRICAICCRATSARSGPTPRSRPTIRSSATCPAPTFPLGSYDVLVLDYMLGRGDGLEWLQSPQAAPRLPEGAVPHRRRQRDHRGARDEGRRRRLPAQAGADAREADHLAARAHRRRDRAHRVARPRRAHGRPRARRQGAHSRHQGAAPDRRGRHGARLPRFARGRRRAAGGEDPAPRDRDQQEGAGALHGGVRPGRAHPEPPRGAHLRPRQLRRTTPTW